MGLFSFLEEIVDRVVDWIDSTFGSSSSYSGSTRETINVEKELEEAKKIYAPEAKKKQREYLDSVMSEFQKFTDQLQVKYPDEVEIVIRKQKKAKAALENIVIGHFNKRMTVADDQLKKILQMEPGKEKGKAIKEQVEGIFNESLGEFNKSLSAMMTELNEELGIRLRQKQNKEEETLNNEIEKLKQLNQDAENGTLDIERLEAEKVPFDEVSYCLTAVLEEGQL